MILDTYSYCPGGTGKKFKHCACRDIAGELDKIIKSLDGDQRIAALDRINRTLATKANRPCLLSLKIMTLMDMNDMQSLEDTVTTFVKVAPDNPLAHTFAALLESRKHRVREAVDELQTALSLVKDVLPGELYDAFEEVAEALAESGEYLAARAHLMLRMSLGSGDKEAARPLLLLSHAERIPPALKRDRVFEGCPSGATWKGRFEAAFRDLASGGWKKGLERFEKLNQDFPGQRAILWNIALARSYLGLPRLPEAWHAYALCPGVEFQQAVEAEALAQLLSMDADKATIGFAKWTIHVRDASALNEKLLSSKLLLSFTGDLSQFRSDDSPPPKSAFTLLDKPLPDAGTELTLDNVPRILTYVVLFGRETDRAARVEMRVPKSDAMQQVRSRLADVAGDLLTSEETEEILDTASRLQMALAPLRYCPPGTPFVARQRILEEATQHDLLQQWPDIPLSALDDKSPRQVLGDPAYRVQLAGALVALEQLAEVHRWPIQVDALRQQMGVPVPESIDPQTVDVSTLSPADWARVIPERLTDEVLLRLHERALVFHAHEAILRLGEEVLRRESLSDKVDLARLCGGLAEMTADSDKAVRYLREARRIAAEKKQSPAKYLLNELPLRLIRGEAPDVTEIIRQLQTRHLREPGVSEALYHILVQFGILTPEGQPEAVPETAEVDEPAPPAAKLWTPGAPPAAADEKKPSQIWVPD
jgi:hypothetical protein